MTYFKYLFAVLVIAVFLAFVFFWGGGQVDRQSRHDELRIVSLSPAVTEILFALGVGDKIVGVTSVCDYPAAAKEIECVGGFGKPNIEKLLDIKASMVIATGFENKTVGRVLQRNGIKVLDLKIRDFDELFGAVSKIGEISASRQKAQKLIADMQAELKVVENKYAGQAGIDKPKIFVELWNSPLTTIGRQSFINDIIEKAGAVNVAGDIEGSYPIINPEKVIEWDPDIIVLCYMDMKLALVSDLGKRIGWGDISAVKNGRIINDMPTNIFLRPGPRMVEAVKELAMRIYSPQMTQMDAD